MPTIVDGTVLWTNSSGQQRYGYTANGQWQNNVNTTIRCEYYAEQVGSGGAPHLAYLWCLSIGASSYSHNCGDGHTITRRWAWKQYASPGSYSPQLTIFNASTNSQCGRQLNFVGTAVDENAISKTLRITVQESTIHISSDAALGLITIVDAKGSVVHTGSHAGTSVRIALPEADGMYALRAGNGEVRRFSVAR